MTRALASEFGPVAITVNSIAPGTFATETNAELAADPDWAAWLRGRNLLPASWVAVLMGAVTTGRLRQSVVR